MDLAFKKSCFSYLDCVFRGVRYQEETSEMIVPDSESDMEAIIASYADVILRGKECRNGSVVVSGGIKGCIVYRPEDHSGPKDLKFYLPFTLKEEHPALTEDTILICSLKVSSVDGRMLNSRKAMLRVNIGCSLQCFERKEEFEYELENMPEEMQIRERTYSFRQAVESAEKSFVISENLELSQNVPPIVRVVKELCRLELTEKKLVGNKAVFKGIILFQLLYASEDKQLYSHHQQIPFSQYCEFQNDYEEQSVELLPCLTGYDLQLSADSSTSAIPLTVSILVQSVVHESRTSKLVDDAYCIGAEFKPQWRHYSLESQLDENKERRQLRCQLRGDISEIIDVTLYADHPLSERNIDEIKITNPVCVQVLGLTENGELTSLQSKISDARSYALSDRANCNTQSNVAGSISSNLFSGGAEVSFELQCESRFTATQELTTLSGGEVNRLENNHGQRPSLIIKRVEKDTDLWEIAKSNHARMESICAANHLHEAQLGDEQILLIPVG